ncbi:hypothetical protein [Aliarcobacter butzleri]|uniref:hypothetical protein n=1 Tax=Aliarcobacter butzleri TaxID=28197 RepID=UPI00125FF008|nr:hypothetical protein [Aliarcobacter butzleri]
MKKISFLALSLLLCKSLFAASLPNIWTTGYGQGWLEYKISNKSGQELLISCNEGYDDETDHSITFYNGTNNTEYNSENIAFIIDGNAYYPLALPTSTRNGGNNWYEFSSNISKGETIEIYYNNSKIGEFTPTKGSRDKILKDGLCDSMFSKI